LPAIRPILLMQAGFVASESRSTAGQTAGPFVSLSKPGNEASPGICEYNKEIPPGATGRQSPAAGT
jgi:hypothetical protein